MGVRLLIQSSDDFTFLRGGKGCWEWFFPPRYWLSNFLVFTCQHPGLGDDRCLQSGGKVVLRRTSEG